MLTKLLGFFDKPKPRPCPICKNKPGVVLWGGEWLVYCPKCKYMGLYGKTEKEAIKLWNE